jgi:ABC-2 type transport system permease protein
LKNIKHLLVKDIIRFLNDKPALLLTFLVPAVLIFIFGNIFGGHNGRSKVPVILVNESNSKLSKVFESKLDSSSSIYLLRYYTEEGDTTRKKYTEDIAGEKIKAGERSAAVIFPDDFYSDTSMSVKIKFLYDPKDEISAGIIEGSIQQAIMGSIPDVLPELMNRQMESQIGKKAVKLFENDLTKTISKYFDVRLEDLVNESDSTSIFNPSRTDAANLMNNLIRIENIQLVGKELKSPNVTRIVGGWAIMFLLFSITAVASSLIEEKQEGTLKRLLCMPVNRSDILWGKYIFSIIIGIVQLSVLFFFAWILFDVEIFSNFFNLCIVILVSAAAAVSFGMIITATSTTMQQANGIATLVILVMSALGGSWFPTFFFPDWMQTLSKLTLTYWSVEAFQQVLWRQGDLASISINLIVLVSIAIIVNYYAIILFKRGKIF